MREVGIDGRQAEQVADTIPAACIRANIAHVRKAMRDPKGGAHFKGICEDWAGWMHKHAAAHVARASIEAKPDPYAELAIFTDADWPAVVAEAIDAMDNAAARESMREQIKQHGTPRNSPTLNSIVLAHVQRAAVT